MSWSDEEIYMSPYEMVQHYFRQPSGHRLEGEGEGPQAAGHGHVDAEDAGSDVDSVRSDGANPEWNVEQPHSFDDSPIKTEYMKIPLSEEYSSIVSVYIKRSSFLRQKNFALEDHLFRVVFVPKNKVKNHVILLTSLLGAVKEVVSW
jgi:hypothetical protein